MAYQPHEWVNGETITAEKLNKIEDGIANSGELPQASSSNEGQALVSTKKYVKGAVIVPQQRVELEDGVGEPSNANASLFTEGTVCIWAADGIEGVGTINDNLTLGTLGEDGFFIDDALLYGGEGTYADIALYVAEPVYSWEPDPYAGYDIIFQVKKDPDVYLPLNEIIVSDIEIVKGSIEALEQKLLNGYKVNGLFEVITSYNGNGYDSYNCWQMAYFDTPYRVISFGRSSINGASSYTILTLFYKSDYTLESITFGS